MLMKDNFQSKSVPRGTRTIWRYLGALFILFTFAIGNVWAAASTTTDGKYATGTIDFSTIGTLSGTTTYWHNGVKFYSGNATSISANNTAWSTSVSIPAYVSNVTAGKDANKCKWGNGGTAKQYTQSGFACSQHTIGIHVNQACTLTIVVNKNVGSDTDDAGISASIDNVAYGTAYTSSTYKAAGSTALTVTSARADKTNASGRYTLTIVVGSGDLKNGEAVVKMFNGSSGSGAGKLFCWESITVTPAATPTAHTVTYKSGYDEDLWIVDSDAKTVTGCPTQFSYTGYDFAGWKDSDNNDVEVGATVTSDMTLTAQWTEHTTASTNANLSALSVAGCELNETFNPATTAYTISLPFYGVMPAASAVTATKEDSHASDPVVSVEGNVITVEVTPESGAADKKTYTITVNIADAPTASSSINIEQLVLDNSKAYNIGAALETAHIGYTNKNDLDSLSTAAERNEPYLGLKFKSSSSTITIIVPANETLKVKFGARKTTVKVAINDGAVSDASISNNIYSLAAASAVRKVKFSVTENNKTIVLKQIMVGEDIKSVTLPWLVTYDAGEHGTCTTAKQTWKGEGLTLPEVTVASGWDFDGWYDGETKVTSPYNPGKDAALVAHYTAQAAGTDLETLTYQIGAGAATAVGYEVGYFTYNVEVPYAPSYEAITVAATPVSGASIKDDETKVLTVSSLPGTATFTVTDGVNEQLYTVNFKKAAKTGVEIIGVVTTGGNNKDVSGLYKGDATVNLDSDKKIGNGKYIYVTLASGYTFEETDVLVVDVNKKSDLPNDPALEITTGVGNISGSVWKSIANADYELHLVTIPLTGIAEGQTSIGLNRSEHQNTWVNGLKVYRPMNPVLTAITINGETCVKGEGNTFSITLPEEGTDLAALTVVPTIIRNAAHATTPEAVISNSGAWKADDNTYRVMDKDGDYTDYTITITLQGEAPAPVISTQPAGVAYCAGSEPTLEVVATGDELHYAWFKEAGETDEAVGTDQASYTVEAAGTYYVIVTNHVDGKLDKSITSANAVVTMNAAAAITTQPTNKRDVVAGSEVTLSVVATNATGYQWYSCEDAEKHNAVAITGAEAANYVFTCNANGFYYCVVGNACGDDITSNVVSVKLEPEGCNTFASIPAAEPYNYEQTGEWTFYYVDSNGADKSTDNVFKDGKNFDDEDVIVADTRRFALKFEKDVESVTLYGVGGDKSFTKVSVSNEMVKNTYTQLTTTATKVDLTSKNHIYTVENIVIPGGKYAWFEFSGSLTFFKICYTEALAMPKLPTLGNQELCAGAAYETFDASITNAAACEGTVSYAWYKTTDTENPVATTATYTPTEDAIYYVVVKHVKAGHMTRVAQSAELTVAHFAAPALVSYSENVFQHMGTAAELSVVATGSGLAYAWYTCDVDGGNAEVISGAEEATYAIASIAEGVQYYKVVISNNCDESTLSHIFKVEGWDQLEQVDVTESTVWDMNNVSASEINLASFEPSKQNVLLLLANIEGVNNNASFNSQALMFEGQRIGRTENNVKYVSGQYVQFNVTVPGMVSVTFAGNGSAQRTILINGKQCSRTTTSSNYIRYDVAVEPGSVEIEDVQGYVRISKIEFKAEDNYHRAVNPSYLGTLCWTNNAILGGATLYEFAGKNEYNYLVFDEVDENRLEAGKPYIFMPENGSTEIKVYNTDNEAALTEDQAPVNHMYGTITGKTLVPGVNDNMYYFSASHIWAVKDFVVEINVPAYYCYVDYEAVLNGSPAPEPAPGRRRVSMGVQGQQVATGIENVQGDKVQCTKMLINGQLFILRGEKMYDAKGQLVK